jgi:hypothetical protein
MQSFADAEGMELEMKGQIEEAARLFAVSWDGSSDDFERCIAAPYVARHQRKGSRPWLKWLGTPPVWRVDRTESLGRSSILRQPESSELRCIEILQLHWTALECSD